MSFLLYVVGYLVMTIGLAYGAYLLHVPTRWIAAGVIVMLGLGIITGVTSMRHKDPVS